MRRAATFIATVAGAGYLRPAPGTWGSAVSLPLAYAVYQIGGFPLIALGTVAACAIGWWATAIVTRGATDHDPSEIVIDELAGQWIALLPLLYAAWSHDIPALALYPGWISAFLLFRLFDITKPGPIGWADRRGDALGVMLDDVIAGAFAGIGTMILAGIAHGALGL